MKKLSLGERYDRAAEKFKVAKEELGRVRALIMVEGSIVKGTVLTRRETEILFHLRRGLQNKEIANKLNIAVRTVKFHVSRLLVKTGCEDRYQLGSGAFDEDFNKVDRSGITPSRDSAARADERGPVN